MRAFVLLAMCGLADGYSSIAGSCISAQGGHGKMRRGTGGFSLQIENNDPDLLLLTLKGGDDTHKWDHIRGFLLRTSAGVFTDVPDSAQHLACPPLESKRGHLFPGEEEASISHLSSGPHEQITVGLATPANKYQVELMVIVLTDMSDWYQFAQTLTTTNDTTEFTLASPFVFDADEPTRGPPRKQQSVPTAQQVPSFPPSQPVLNDDDAPSMVPSSQTSAGEEDDYAPSMAPSTSASAEDDHYAPSMAPSQDEL
jgi:hypothetical protein